MRPQNMRVALFVAMAVTVALSGCGKQDTKATVSSESRSQQVEPSSDPNPSFITDDIEFIDITNTLTIVRKSQKAPQKDRKPAKSA